MSWQRADISSFATFSSVTIPGFHIVITTGNQFPLTAANVFHLQLNDLVLIHICTKIWILCIFTLNPWALIVVKLSDQHHYYFLQPNLIFSLHSGKKIAAPKLPIGVVVFRLKVIGRGKSSHTVLAFPNMPVIFWSQVCSVCHYQVIMILSSVQYRCTKQAGASCICTEWEFHLLCLAEVSQRMILETDAYFLLEWELRVPRLTGCGWSQQLLGGGDSANFQ